MTTFSLSRAEIISTVDFIVERYEELQLSRWEQIRVAINPSVIDFRFWRDCFLSDWERAGSELQGICLLFSNLSDSDDLIKYLKRSKEKITNLWSQCGVDLSALQHSEYKASIVGGNQESSEEVGHEVIQIEAADSPLIILSRPYLSDRVLNIFSQSGIRTFDDLLCKTEFDLLKLSHFGRHSLIEVTGFLSQRGLSLSGGN
jgi:hypothetical protein